MSPWDSPGEAVPGAIRRRIADSQIRGPKRAYSPFSKASGILPPTDMEDELRHRILRILADHPEVNQRELASILGVSLGKANYCLGALIERGWIKARNFKNNRNKLAYAYYLTPQGIEEKARLTVRFFRRKVREYEELKAQLDELEKEAEEARVQFPKIAALEGVD